MCERIVDEFKYNHLSSGDLLRAEVARGTELGLQLDTMMKKGELVPLEITLRLIREAMERADPDAPGFLLDGFPRHLDQALSFESQITKCKFALVFECPEEVLIQRLLKRSETSGRADDNIETIRMRFKTFAEVSKDAIEYFEKEGRCVKISSVSAPDEVYTQARKHFSDKQVKEDDVQSQAVEKKTVVVQEPKLPVEEAKAVSQHHGRAWDNIVFVLGAPGTGKGTQCDRIVAEFEYTHLSTGDLLRAEVASGSELGQQLDAMMTEGKLVPLETTLRLIREAMERADPEAPGFLLDGFPRELPQAHAFESQIAKCKFVLVFDCPEEALIRRLLKRGETSGRADDNIETITKRFKTFQDASRPVIKYFEGLERCVKISSDTDPEEVYEQTRAHFIEPAAAAEKIAPTEPDAPETIESHPAAATEEKKKHEGKAWENIIFVLGGPGSGKGTQCERLVNEFKYNHLSAGDLLRAEVSKGTELGLKLDRMMKEGQIVPMETTLQILQAAMESCDADAPGFLIDGFPRALDQAVAFEEQIKNCKFVLAFECPEDVLVERLLKRGETSGRADDSIETIKKRFKTFVDISSPVIEHFEKQGRCVKISSEAAVDEVYEMARAHFL
ncbi:hypothetical protein SeMB42_g07182 [Synchytrium endobioticum]|nr:hypothetical protein SeMB42_g07182 [Synchytrium endobioticum]